MRAALLLALVVLSIAFAAPVAAAEPESGCYGVEHDGKMTGYCGVLWECMAFYANGWHAGTMGCR